MDVALLEGGSVMWGKPRYVGVSKLLISSSSVVFPVPVKDNSTLLVLVPKALGSSLAPLFLSYFLSHPSANAVRSPFEISHKSNHFFSLRQLPLNSKPPPCLTWVIAKAIYTVSMPLAARVIFFIDTDNRLAVTRG